MKGLYHQIDKFTIVNYNSYMRKFLVMFFLCLSGAVLNSAIPALLTDIMRPPLFLDTIFTVSITLLFGLRWGALCGFLNSIFAVTILSHDWVVFLFVFCTVGTAAVTSWLMRFFPEELNLVPLFAGSSSKQSNKLYKSSKLNGVMSVIIALILLSFVLAIIMSVLGGIISTIINVISRSAEVMDIVTPQSTRLTGSMFSSDMSFLLKEILVRIPINIIDRLITVFAAYGIARFICWGKKKLGR